MKIKHFFVWCAIYRQQVMVIFGVTNSDEALRYVSKLQDIKKDFQKAFCGFLKDHKEMYKKGMCYSLDSFPPIIIFPRYNPRDIEDVACIVHETSHAIDALVHTCSLQGEEETRAYLHEFLFTVIKSELDKYTKKNT